MTSVSAISAFVSPFATAAWTSVSRAVSVSRPGAGAVPVGRMVLIAGIAGFAGVVAATGPARRAARLDILGAIASE